jgi:hypothetical protein
MVYNSGLCLVGQASATNSLGATISVTACVSSGQGYYFKVLAAGGPGSIGAYGLLVNFGSHAQPPIQPPNTVVAQQPDRGGGTVNSITVVGPLDPGGSRTPAAPPVRVTIGTLSGWAKSYTENSPPPASSSNPIPPIVAPAQNPAVGLGVALVGSTAPAAAPPATAPSPRKTVHRPRHVQLPARHFPKHTVAHVKLHMHGQARG